MFMHYYDGENSLLKHIELSRKSIHSGGRIQISIQLAKSFKRKYLKLKKK